MISANGDENPKLALVSPLFVDHISNARHVKVFTSKG
jgi:hypothetical protein